VRASIQDVARVIKSAGVPKQITQKPFDHDPGHYRRLCLLNGAEPQASDLWDYAMDMQYMEVQPDLLRYLTPILLKAWRRNLFEGSSAGLEGFVELFWPALLNGAALKRVFSERERDAFGCYMRNSILDRLDAEESLRFSGMGTSPYRWVSELISYGTLFSDIQTLWTEWWQVKTSGQAVAAFQFASALMYEKDKNPVFDAWTKEKGGGPPALYNCSGMMFNVGWKHENLAFLKATLSADYFEQKLREALEQIQNTVAKKLASGIIDDFPGQRARLELRIEQLITLLTDVSGIDGFTI